MIQKKDALPQPIFQDAKRLRKIYRSWVLFYAVLVDNLLARHHWERSSLAVRWSNATRLFSRYFLRLLLKNAKKVLSEISESLIKKININIVETYVEAGSGSLPEKNIESIALKFNSSVLSA